MTKVIATDLQNNEALKNINTFRVAQMAVCSFKCFVIFKSPI